MRGEEIGKGRTRNDCFVSLKVATAIAINGEEMALEKTGGDWSRGKGDDGWYRG